MADGADLHPLQQAFWDQHGLQCGFCTPGMIMQAAWLLGENADPTEDGDPRGDQRQPVPLHRLREHRQGDPAGGRRAWPRAAETRRPARPAGRGRMSGSDEMTTEAAAPRPPPRSGAWATRSSARKTRASSAARASTSTTSNLPGKLWLDIVRSPYAHATIKGIDATEALEDPGRPCGHHRQADLEKAGLHWMPTLAGDKQMVLPTDTVMYQAQEVAAVVADDPLHRRRRRRRGHGRLRAAAGHRRPVQGARGRRVRPAARPRPGQADQPHLALGIGRQGRGRRGPRRRRGDRLARTSTSRASTSPRSRRAAASPTGSRSAAS